MIYRYILSRSFSKFSRLFSVEKSKDPLLFIFGFDNLSSSVFIIIKSELSN